MWDPLRHMLFFCGGLVCGITAIDLLWCYELEQVNCNFSKARLVETTPPIEKCVIRLFY